MAVGFGQDAHSGKGLVGFQEVGVSLAEEGAETSVDHDRDKCDEGNQVDQAGKSKQKNRRTIRSDSF